MRPRLSHWCRDVLANARLFRATTILFLALGFSQPCGAQQANPETGLGTWTPLSIEQVRDAASLALPRSESRVDAKLLKVTRRSDLEYLLSTIVQRSGSQGLFLYQVELPSQTSYDGQWTWIVAVAPVFDLVDATLGALKAVPDNLWNVMLVGIGGYPSLLDGSSVTAPHWALWFPNGKWDVENIGVSPDVEVEMDPRVWREGRDPQLEKAIAIVKEELERNPLKWPKRPAYPNYHKK